MSEMPRAARLTLLLALGRCVEFGPCELSVELDSATYRVRFDLGDEPRSVASDLVARLPAGALGYGCADAACLVDFVSPYVAKRLLACAPDAAWGSGHQPGPPPMQAFAYPPAMPAPAMAGAARSVRGLVAAQ